MSPRQFISPGTDYRYFVPNLRTREYKTSDQNNALKDRESPGNLSSRLDINHCSEPLGSDEPTERRNTRRVIISDPFESKGFAIQEQLLVPEALLINMSIFSSNCAFDSDRSHFGKM
ncbi:hypothetical protein AVEN_218545-1 [Araneus ventricosus]|uniref:Uncharacterized protein n=1 Tax=Araneus ventricosus TaxID=182803 RepID=A0A4Y2WU82_ARAVE|nr:hypothetical protein AVEN_218545-1 [Araneus ventricosus]